MPEGASPAGALLAASMLAASCVTLPDGPHTTDVLPSAVQSSAASCAWLGSDNCAVMQNNISIRIACHGRHSEHTKCCNSLQRTSRAIVLRMSPSRFINRRCQSVAYRACFESKRKGKTTVVFRARGSINLHYGQCVQRQRVAGRRERRLLLREGQRAALLLRIRNNCCHSYE